MAVTLTALVATVVVGIIAGLATGVVGYDGTHRYARADLDRVAAKINHSASSCELRPRAHVDLRADRVVIDVVAPSDARLTGDEQAMVDGGPLPPVVGCTIGT